MKILTTTTLALLLGMPAASANAPADITPGNTAFALELYAKLKTQPGNLFFSPHSISSALAMTSAGAAEKTLEQMTATLRLPAGDATHAGFAAMEKHVAEIQAKGKVRILVANSIWPDGKSKFLPAFLDTGKKFYNAEITPQDFQGAFEAARITINKWVEKKTNDRIKDLLPPGSLSALTRMVLVNAIYFKGDWAAQFNARQTRPDKFFTSATESILVPLMFQKGKFDFAATPDLQVLRLPYAGDDLSMLVLLPLEKDGLEKLEARLSPDNLKQWAGALRNQEVQVWLPKFKAESSFSLNQVLTEMGMSDAFDMGKADFSRMNGGKDLYISAVVHKAFVEVNEEGTEAAAATGVVIATRMARIEPPPAQFRADHPFLYLIRENKTGAILFMGRCATPPKADAAPARPGKGA